MGVWDQQSIVLALSFKERQRGIITTTKKPASLSSSSKADRDFDAMEDNEKDTIIIVEPPASGGSPPILTMKTKMTKMKASLASQPKFNKRNNTLIDLLPHHLVNLSSQSLGHLYKITFHKTARYAHDIFPPCDLAFTASRLPNITSSSQPAWSTLRIAAKGPPSSHSNRPGLHLSS